MTCQTLRAFPLAREERLLLPCRGVHRRLARKATGRRARRPVPRDNQLAAIAIGVQRCSLGGAPCGDFGLGDLAIRVGIEQGEHSVNEQGVLQSKCLLRLAPQT